MNNHDTDSASRRDPGLNRARASRLHVTPLLMTVAALVALLVTQATPAADVTVHVSKRGAAGPADNVAVCLGTRGVPAQFGAVRTDKSGTAKFRDVPTTEIILTASKSGMQGQKQILSASAWDRSLVVSLPPGGGGPECSAPAAATVPTVERTVAASGSFGLGIREFRINNGKRATKDPTVTLDFAYSGEATHYRVSEGSDLGAAKWRPIDGERRFELSESAGRKTLYLQVRRHIEVQGSAMESVSDVARDSILLERS